MPTFGFSYVKLIPEPVPAAAGFGPEATLAAPAPLFCEPPARISWRSKCCSSLFAFPLRFPTLGATDDDECLAGIADLGMSGLVAALRSASDLAVGE